ncbi:hypothetical protein KY285_010580 [Solanum tuberosum]|nr:hypothetical protein KY285_010580 [Solanum tuberosum]
MGDAMKSKFAEDGSLNTLVGNESLHLDEALLEKILEVPREGTRSLVGKSYTRQFVKECSKLPDMCLAGVQKKLMKGEYKLLSEFINKVLFPRTKKRTGATTDLFLMKSLCKFEPVNLPALMLEHMNKTNIEHKGKHGMGYGESKTTEPDVSVGNGTKSTEARIGGVIVLVSNKDAEIALLKAQLLKALTEGPSIEAVKELRLQNAALLTQNAALQEKLNKDNDEANARLTLVIKSLSHQPPSI